MADDSELIGQNEIENLLSQVNGAAAPQGDGSDASGSGAVQQDEIDSLLSGIGESNPAASGSGVSAPAMSPAVATAVAPGSTSKPANSAATSPGDDIHLLLDQAEAAVSSVNESGASQPAIAPFRFQDFTGSPASAEQATIDLLRDVELDLKIELGRTNMELEEVLKLHRGSVVPLDKLAGDPVDVYVNGRLVARGEVLVLNDNFCVRVAELISGEERSQSEM
jgi:flagellar motor switch protein FliN/FliY